MEVAVVEFTQSMEVLSLVTDGQTFIDPSMEVAWDLLVIGEDNLLLFVANQIMETN